MRWFTQFLVVGVGVGVANATLNIKKFRPALSDQALHVSSADEQARSPPLHVPRQTAPPRFLTSKTQRFSVDGKSLPNVDFDVGESYAGSLPISADANDTNQLFFWFFPSENQTVEKEITIWLTGGPGCSSVGELMSSNGPFLWPTGVFKPIRNKWSWHRLTNMVWIDQPVGTGYSQGTVTARNEQDVARQFMGFWRNFVDTFAMQGYKVYVTGSSYSGMYCPYIASAMLDANDAQYFDVKGMQIWDGVFARDVVTEDIPVAKFAAAWSDVFGFNDSFTSSLREKSKTCGYDDFLEKHIRFPPTERQPSALPGLQADQKTYVEGCDLWNQVFSAAQALNPCFSVYTITQLCPLQYDPLGFSDGRGYVPDGAGPAYFDRPDVKAALHAPPGRAWAFCTNDDVFVDGADASLDGGPASQPVLPGVVDRTRNVIVGHGLRDFVLLSDGTLLAIQNMTWGGRTGFQARPAAPLYVPYHGDLDDPTALAGAGVVGTAHAERGLTYLTVGPAGHFLTLDAPAVAFRSLEVLLGRTSGFQSTAPFTTDTNKTAQPDAAAMGKGTLLIGDGGLLDSCPLRGGRGSAVTEAEEVPRSQAGRAQGSTLRSSSIITGLVLFLGLFLAW